MINLLKLIINGISRNTSTNSLFKELKVADVSLYSYKLVIIKYFHISKSSYITSIYMIYFVYSYFIRDFLCCFWFSFILLLILLYFLYLCVLLTQVKGSKVFKIRLNKNIKVIYFIKWWNYISENIILRNEK